MRKLFFVIPFLISFADITAQNLYDSTYSKQFADYLIRTRQYPLAIIELERLVFLQPLNDTLKTKLVRSYSLNKSHQQALVRIRSFSPDPLQLDSGLSSYYAYNLLADKQFLPASAFITSTPAFSSERRLYYTAWNSLLQSDFKTASAILSAPAANTPALIPLRQMADDGLNVKRKSPAIATLMSVVIPGSGKFYAGEKKDAVVSFLTVGLMAFQAYRGFSKNGVKSTYGWIFGGLGGAFYIGNLYGSNHAAKRYNKRQLNNVNLRIEDSFYLHP